MGNENSNNIFRKILRTGLAGIIVGGQGVACSPKPIEAEEKIIKDQQPITETVPPTTVSTELPLEEVTPEVSVPEELPDSVDLTEVPTEIPTAVAEEVQMPYSFLAEHLLPDGGFVDKLSVEKPIFALTIDDGYDKNSMEAMLDILKQNDVNATFFIIGDAAKYDLGPELLKRAVEEGNEICYHSMKHDQEDIKDWTKDDWIKDYEEWEVLMKEMLGEELYAKGVKNYTRAPGGLFNNAFLAMAKEKELIPFGWNTSPAYWDSGVRPKGGDILIIHVGYEDVGNMDRDIHLENIKPVTLTELVEEYVGVSK